MSLTRTAKTFRKGIKVGAIVVFTYYVMILFVIPVTRNFILNLLVDKNPPNPKYGLLDPLRFRPADFKGKPELVLNTKDGRLPAGLPIKMPVYKFKGIQYSYLATKGAQYDATILGFSEAELISDLKGKEYVWRSLVSGGVLRINTETQSLNVGTDLIRKTSQFPAGLLDANKASDISEAILIDLGRYNKDIYKPANFRITFGEYAGNNLRETKVPGDAQMALVDVYGNIDGYPIFGPDAKNGQMTMILKVPENSAKPSPYNFPYMELNYWSLSAEKDASYPIISVKEAWKQVLSGKGVVASAHSKEANSFGVINPPTVAKVFIHDIYLAYYQTPEFQSYLQPIYVFDGRYQSLDSDAGDFIVYYPALTAEWTRKIPAKTITPPSPQTPQSTESQP